MSCMSRREFVSKSTKTMRVFRVLEDLIQEFDLGIERTKDKTIAKCCALVVVLDRSSIKI
jgi:hypothetical protein